MRILVVEDEAKVARFVARGLRAERFAVNEARDGIEGLALARTYDYDLVILDLMLPKLDGTRVLGELRRHNSSVPVLVLTARDGLPDKVRNFEAGADDYLTKPFAFAELMVRVKTLLRRASGHRSDLLRVADLEIDRSKREVRRAGRRIELTAKEYVPRTGDELERLSLALNRMIARLEEAFQQATRFSADASHELRTPLTILRGELESTLSEPELHAEARERIESALEETERLSRIVEGLLALARLDAGEAGSAGVLRFDLGALAIETADQMRLLAEDKGVALDCGDAASVEIEADRARVKQVVVNLLDNAIKYTPAGGEVRIRVASSDGNAVLEVCDSGVGIAPEALPHVFERFYRVDRVRSRDEGGAGLGLSIVQSIASVHGGSVEVESAERRGSLFRVVLPRTAGASERTGFNRPFSPSSS